LDLRDGNGKDGQQTGLETLEKKEGVHAETLEKKDPVIKELQAQIKTLTV